jgi:hypothetical protein
MVSEGSLLYSQKPATCFYPKPDKPVRAPSHFLKTILIIHIILQFTPQFSKWCPFLRFPHQNTVRATPVFHMCHMPRPSHYPRSDHLHNHKMSRDLILSRCACSPWNLILHWLVNHFRHAYTVYMHCVQLVLLRTRCRLSGSSSWSRFVRTEKFLFVTVIGCEVTSHVASCITRQ